jgi:hypothetical protein
MSNLARPTELPSTTTSRAANTLSLSPGNMATPGAAVPRQQQRYKGHQQELTRRRQRPPVGVATSSTDGGDLVAANGNASPPFVGSIMHRVVSTRGFVVDVLVRASRADVRRFVGGKCDTDDELAWLDIGNDDWEDEDTDISFATGLAVAQDENVRDDTERARSRALFYRCAQSDSVPILTSRAECAGVSTGRSRRRRRQRALSPRPSSLSSSLSSAGGSGGTSDEEVEATGLPAVDAVCKLDAEGSAASSASVTACGLGGRFAGLADVGVERACEEEVAFARDLYARLLAVDGCIVEDNLVESETKGNQIQSGNGTTRCGFGDAHEAINVVCDNYAICKTGKGLYRTAFGVPRPPALAMSSFYFEVYVFEDCAQDGMTIGIASAASLSLAKLVGSDAHSAGLHSSGRLVSSSGSFSDHSTAGFSKGDRVGVLVTYPALATTPSDPHSSLASSATLDRYSDWNVNVQTNVSFPTVHFTINGMPAGEPVLLPTIQPLAPAVSLYRTGSKAVIRCCAADWGAATPAGAWPFCGVCRL